MGGASPAQDLFAVVADNEYVTIATRGNAADFGDLLEARWYAGACASPFVVSLLVESTRLD